MITLRLDYHGVFKKSVRLSPVEESLRGERNRRIANARRDNPQQQQLE
jgi:hypothetical protein